MKNALISVFDKRGSLELATFLSENGWNIISSGGTYRYLKENGVNVKTVEDVTHSPEILNGRVKTLHPKIHGGILALRNNPAHMETLKEQEIDTIDLVCVNLYPFEEKRKELTDFDALIEFIDIGGPSMLRSASKNFRDVFVLSSPDQYEDFMTRYREDRCDFNYRKSLALDVFRLTSHYDNEIANFLSDQKEAEGLSTDQSEITLHLIKEKDLKYGENPHQKAAFYRIDGINGFMTDFEQLNGKDMGYINYRDLESAWKIVSDFEEPACAAIKHNTPCGVALGNDVADSYRKAFSCDTVSIFGGIVACNREINEECANEMVKIMLHIVAAPSFTEEALNILKTKKNMIIIKMNSTPSGNKLINGIDGGVTIQDEDTQMFNELKVVTEKAPDEDTMEELKFAMKVVKFVKSNAIVVTKDRMAIGIGGGFVNRIDAAAYALRNINEPCVLASDAFFPFDDVVTLAGEKGIKAIIQPGGSVNDELSVKKCNELGIPMIFTGMRHFRH